MLKYLIFLHNAINGIASKTQQQQKPIQIWAKDLNSHSSRYKAVSHCGFDFHFPND